MKENKNDTTACGYRDGLINVILHGNLGIPIDDLEEMSTSRLEDFQRKVFENYAEEKNLDYSMTPDGLNKVMVEELFFKEKFKNYQSILTE